MSFVGTLAKVAVGVALAKGVSSLAKGPQSSGGGLLGRKANGTGTGIEGMVRNLLGGEKNHLGQSSGGGLGGLMERLGTSSSSVRSRSHSAGSGGMSDALSRLSREMGGAKGGLGALMAGLGTSDNGKCIGHTPAQRQTSERSFGDQLNDAFNADGEPRKTPSPAQNVAAAVMIKAMVQAAKADGVIDEAERTRLLERLSTSNEAERAFVAKELEAPVDAAALARQVPKGLEAQCYAISVMAIDLDNPKEADYLDQLAKAMGLEQTIVNKIHTQLGVPVLYT